MASRAFRNRFRNTCCSLPALPCTGGRPASRSVSTSMPDFLQLMLQQRKRFLDHLVQVHFAERGGGSAREIQQRIDDLAGAEGLLGDLVEDERFLRRPRPPAWPASGRRWKSPPAAYSLRAPRRPPAARCCDSLSACTRRCSSSARSVTSSKMISRPICSQVLGNQRRDGDVQRGFPECARPFDCRDRSPWPLPLHRPAFQHELVDVMDAGFAAHAVELLHQVGREQFRQLAAHGARRARCR